MSNEILFPVEFLPTSHSVQKTDLVHGSEGSVENVQKTVNADDRISSAPSLEEMPRARRVLAFLQSHKIPFTWYSHPEGKTIQEASRWWRNDGSIHCKNLFLRNHKGDRHYLVCFHCEHVLAIHDLERRLKASLKARGLPACGKLSFASPQRMMRFLGLEPGSVSPFGLINDQEHCVHLFLDACLENAELLSFHPNDCRGTVVISKEAFLRYLQLVENTYEFLSLY